jgi:hypothetical protein
MEDDKKPITLSDVVSRMEIANQLSLLNDAVNDIERKIDSQALFNRNIAVGVLMILVGILIRAGFTL